MRNRRGAHSPLHLWLVDDNQDALALTKRINANLSTFQLKGTLCPITRS